MLAEEAGDMLMHSQILTDITNSTLERNKVMFKLTDLFLNYDKIPDEERDKNAFRVRFYCLRIDP